MVEYEVVVPPDVQVEVGPDGFRVSGKLGSLSKTINLSRMRIEKKDSKIILAAEKPRAAEKALLGTAAAHLRNMVRGVTDGFKYTLKVFYVHFPISVSVEGRQVMIRNFLGEKRPRRADIVGKASVEVRGDEIIVTGADLEEVSQTAANIEQATFVTAKDRRQFQDAIVLVSRGE